MQNEDLQPKPDPKPVSVTPIKPAPKATIDEYNRLYAAMQVQPGHADEIQKAIAAISFGIERYEALVNQVNPKCPWYAVGIAHYMECNCNFNKHIHNGDSLLKRTVNEPKNRPVAGNPPFNWEYSAADWMALKGWGRWQDWKPADILARLELNNGLGYRYKGIFTPYLWSYTQFYVKGKYAADGVYNSELISKQVGAAILLKHFAG